MEGFHKHIVVLEGDGIGPEVMREAIKVMETVNESLGLQVTYSKGLIGATAIDATGDPLPQSTLDQCEAADAILLGAIGDPKYDNNPDAPVRPEDGLLNLRKSLGLYANIRPIKIFEGVQHLSVLKEHVIQGVDFVIYRELTGGIYFNDKWTKGDVAADTCLYSVEEIRRIAKLAFEAARGRHRKLTLVDKANVLETSRLWRKTVDAMKADYPDVLVDYMFIDNAAMQVIVNPARFDVILTSNMFGDILSDEASVISGSLGMLPSASMGHSSRLYEPVHGSYPQAAGKDIANPFAMILSLAMMYRAFQLTAVSDAIVDAVNSCLKKGVATEDIFRDAPCKCSEAGDAVCFELQDKLTQSGTIPASLGSEK